MIQDVGMLAQTKDIPAVQNMLEAANRILGYDLLDRCTNGEHSSFVSALQVHCVLRRKIKVFVHTLRRMALLQLHILTYLKVQYKRLVSSSLFLHTTDKMAGTKADLDDTEVAQPALFVAGLAAAERLRAQVSAKALVKG